MKARGFWFELLRVVKAESAGFPETKGVYPIKAPLGSFTDNLAHSFQSQGISTYTHGYRPDNPTSFQYGTQLKPALSMVVCVQKGAFQECLAMKERPGDPGV